MPVMGNRLKELRAWRGWRIADAAAALGYSYGGYTKLEAKPHLNTKVVERAAKVYGVPADVVMGNAPIESDYNPNTESPQSIQPNADRGGPVDLAGSGETLPVYGQARGGDDGEFVLNGSKLADLLTPPILRGVRDAYAVYVIGESMEPRYFAGEAVYVHPHLPVRREHFVVIQVRGAPGDPPHGYIKQYLGKDGTNVRLRQFNPDRVVTFPESQVVSIHRIVHSGEPF